MAVQPPTRTKFLVEKAPARKPARRSPSRALFPSTLHLVSQRTVFWLSSTRWQCWEVALLPFQVARYRSRPACPLVRAEQTTRVVQLKLAAGQVDALLGVPRGR